LTVFYFVFLLLVLILKHQTICKVQETILNKRHVLVTPSISLPHGNWHRIKYSGW